jgi:hypothetical protein
MLEAYASYFIQISDRLSLIDDALKALPDTADITSRPDVPKVKEVDYTGLNAARAIYNSQWIGSIKKFARNGQRHCNL